MTMPRSETVDPLVKCTYHCWSRCVRRAFLCGFDKLTGKNFDHRKQWVVERMQLLVSAFAIEVCAYAVMDNHSHLILRNFPDTAFSWSPEEVARRWLILFPKRRDKDKKTLEPDDAEIEEIVEDPSRVNQLRIRLCNISWFMRCLNENIACRANVEDEVTGRFWEGRFKSTRLDDDAAILTGMIYVDLNPIRSGKVDTPEESHFTSAYLRLCEKAAKHKQLKAKKKCSVLQNIEVPAVDGWLYPVEKIFEQRANFSTEKYLQVLDCTGRYCAPGKSGKIPSELKPILERIEINSVHWPDMMNNFRRSFPRVAGRADKMRLAAKKSGRSWFRGVSLAAECFKI